MTIDLAAGSFKGGYAEGDTLVSVEGIEGSTYGDTLIGNDADNLFRGGKGGDYIDGGAGPTRPTTRRRRTPSPPCSATPARRPSARAATRPATR